MNPETRISDKLKTKDFSAAFALIVENYSERLYWRIRQMVFTHEDADDILQESFIKIWKSLPRFRGESQVFSWLYRIVSNEALNHIKKEKRKGNTADEEHLQNINADTHFDGDEAFEKLLTAIDQLPEKQKEVFKLKYFENLSYEQISMMTHTSVGALKASFHHASTKIKSILNLPH